MEALAGALTRYLKDGVILTDDPDDVAAREMLSDVLVSTGNGSQALASAQALIRFPPPR